MAKGIIGFFKRKKEKSQKNTIITPPIEEKEERIFEIVEKDGQTSVLFSHEKIFTHSEQNPAISIIVAGKKEASEGGSGINIEIIKKIPLKKVYESVSPASCSLLFSDKGYSVDLKIFKKGKKLVYNVKSNQKNKIVQLNVPRETISIKYGYPEVKNIENPFYLEAGVGLVEFPEISEKRERKIWDLTEYSLSQCNNIEGVFEIKPRKRSKTHKKNRKQVKMSIETPAFKTIVPAFYDESENFVKINSVGWWKVIFNKKMYSFHSSADKFQIVKVFDTGVYEPPLALNVVYLSANELKGVVDKKGEQYRQMRDRKDSIVVLPSTESLETIFNAVAICKKHSIKVAVSIMPFLKEESLPVEQLPQDFFVATDSGERYSFMEDGHRYFALDLTNEDVCTYAKNKARALLNSGADALVAERGCLSLCKFCLNGEFMEQAILWPEYWQKLFPEVVKEYPRVNYYTRHNSLNSYKYGIPLQD